MAKSADKLTLEKITGASIPVGSLKTKDSCGVGEFLDLIPFADFCKKCDLELIQILPVNDTGTESSPYSALSAFALNPIYISLKNLPEVSENKEILDEISKLHDVMCIDLCKKMNELRRSQILSKPIVLCIDYIYSHIHSRITVSELAKHLNFSESYLSKLFHKEMGLPISQYILNLKIEKAKNLLQYSEYSMIDISNYLSFSSQSHFIQVFQKYTGMTPHKYRTKHFRTDWDKMNYSDKSI